LTVRQLYHQSMESLSNLVCACNNGVRPVPLGPPAETQAPEHIHKVMSFIFVMELACSPVLRLILQPKSIPRHHLIHSYVQCRTRARYRERFPSFNSGKRKSRAAPTLTCPCVFPLVWTADKYLICTDIASTKSCPLPCLLDAIVSLKVRARRRGYKSGGALGWKEPSP